MAAWGVYELGAPSLSGVQGVKAGLGLVFGWFRGVILGLAESGFGIYY